MSAAAARREAFGERAVAFEADARLLAEAFPSPDVLALADTLSPDAWGAVRTSFSELRKRKEGGLAAIPGVGAWLLVAPLRARRASGYLDGWAE